MEMMATSLLGPPGDVVVRAVETLPIFGTVKGPLTGKAARHEMERVWSLLEAHNKAYAPAHDISHVWASLESGDRQLWTSPL